MTLPSPDRSSSLPCTPVTAIEPSPVRATRSVFFGTDTTNRTDRPTWMPDLHASLGLQRLDDDAVAVLGGGDLQRLGLGLAAGATLDGERRPSGLSQVVTSMEPSNVLSDNSGLPVTAKVLSSLPM